jgi:hypothetical protein
MSFYTTIRKQRTNKKEKQQNHNLTINPIFISSKYPDWIQIRLFRNIPLYDEILKYFIKLILI